MRPETHIISIVTNNRKNYNDALTYLNLDYRQCQWVKDRTKIYQSAKPQLVILISGAHMTELWQVLPQTIKDELVRGNSKIWRGAKYWIYRETEERELLKSLIDTHAAFVESGQTYKLPTEE